jgi:hypothetical protein
MAERIPEGEGHQQRHEHRAESELHGGWIARGDLLGDALVGAEGPAEVALGQVGDVGDVLLPERLIEPKGLAHGHDVLGARPFAGDLHGRIARDQVDQREDERQNPEGDRDHLQQSADDVLDHSV